MKHKWTIVIAVIVLAGGVFFIFGGNDRGADNTANNTPNDLFSFVEENENKETVSKSAESVGNTASAIETETKQTAPENRLLYTNDKYRFSFEYDEDATVSFFREGVGEMALIQSKNGDTSAQVFITPYDEPGPITSARILKDLPDMVIKNEKKGTVGANPAIAFLGRHESLGDTYEIWFIRDESLYQIITKAQTARFLVDIMQSWREI